MSRVLVTGALGFVGPHLVRALRDAQHEVWCSDRRGGDSPTHVACDLTDAGETRAMVTHTRPQQVVHLAAVSSVARSFSEPQHALQNNLLAACNLFEALRGLDGVRVLVVGSAEQYGNVPAEALPVGEEHPFEPASPYAVSKVAQEYLALQYARAYDMHVVLTRSFNHSGPGQSDDFVLASFARQIAEAEAGRREPVLRTGNLDVARDFLDVRDVAAAYVALLARGTSGQAYNVCSGRAHRLRELLDHYRSEARVDVRVEPDPERMRPADLPVLQGDPAKLRAATGWAPQFEIQQTLRDVLDDWRRRVAAHGAAT